jgi:hypothetical protein
MLENKQLREKIEEHRKATFNAKPCMHEVTVTFQGAFNLAIATCTRCQVVSWVASCLILNFTLTSTTNLKRRTFIDLDCHSFIDGYSSEIIGEYTLRAQVKEMSCYSGQLVFANHGTRHSELPYKR